MLHIIQFHIDIEDKIFVVIETSQPKERVAAEAYKIQTELDQRFEDFEDIDDAIKWIEDQLKKHIEDVEVKDFHWIDADMGWVFLRGGDNAGENKKSGYNNLS